ncbi:MAG TPA: rhodanese-like domain-containing protein [Candidatus Polarisedimenticolia bacterium]|nr:rhodanese-like domain-containing protein [Candidatus Polarisedimenticolia bacterium]
MTTDGAKREPRSLEPEEAERLVGEGKVRLLDVRTPDEYATLGHIPGAILLPLDLIPVAPATMPRDGAPILVYCEHGIRSAQAAQFLSQAGFTNVMNLAGGLSRWRGPRDHTPGNPFGESGPSSWLIDNADLLPRGGAILDLACGAGRHALLLAAAGFTVRALDRDPARVGALRDTASRLGLPLQADVVDLESGEVDLGTAAFGLILVVHYLHRPLFPAIRRALRPGGLLLYETFTTHQAARGHPTNPAYLLEPGELDRLVAPLDVLRRREGVFDGRDIAAVAARAAER